MRSSDACNAFVYYVFELAVYHVPLTDVAGVNLRLTGERNSCFCHSKVPVFIELQVVIGRTAVLLVLILMLACAHFRSAGGSPASESPLATQTQAGRLSYAWRGLRPERLAALPRVQGRREEDCGPRSRFGLVIQARNRLAVKQPMRS